MKKVILFLFVLLGCYIIHNLTDKNNIYYLNIGDALAQGINTDNTYSEGYAIKVKNYLSKKYNVEYNDTFTNKDYRITDVINTIKYHDEYSVNKDKVNINQLLKKADIITISLGMKELYYKLFLDSDNIYTYLDSILYDMQSLIDEISKYSDKKVIILGYYNITNQNQDIFSYINLNLEEKAKKAGFDFINLDKVLTKNDNDFVYNNIYPNYNEYQKISEIIVEKIEKY